MSFGGVSSWGPTWRNKAAIQHSVHIYGKANGCVFSACMPSTRTVETQMSTFGRNYVPRAVVPFGHPLAVHKSSRGSILYPSKRGDTAMCGLLRVGDSADEVSENHVLKK